jgi:GNAT superfamily N-acetyltransferase
MSTASPLPTDISITAGGAELLERIEPLWQGQRQFHAELSPLWRESILSSQFPARMRHLMGKAPGDRMLVLIAGTGGEPIGYSITTIAPDGKGEVDSLFVAEPYRGRGIGRTLFGRSVEWLQTRGATRIAVEILDGNHAAQRLYESAGFRVRSVALELVQSVG